VPWLRKSIDANCNSPLSFLYLAASLAHMRRPDEAREATRSVLSLDPKFTLRRIRAFVESDNARILAQRARLLGGDALGGIPEG
jgi:hypothetical protein